MLTKIPKAITLSRKRSIFTFLHYPKCNLSKAKPKNILKAYKKQTLKHIRDIFVGKVSNGSQKICISNIILGHCYRKSDDGS